ncbi:ERCC4 domain-containing protein [Colletotrichum orchidophilum]|uniref:ERCC4 domain-containing protein n=1 Tax=Colletotrichum orchidophilum TaxID=1209926 RepID=A0A1G4AWA0_9PEZI|nr:ERCC4 domain-containing protein [Colletotrichum orchidophilum]OHE93401.1 ERCC4 domain-containing protein [Colletotrichum orchidophilum]
MPPEFISLLSSPSAGPSPINTGPPPSRLAQPVLAAVATALAYGDEEVFDLTAESPEIAPKSPPLPSVLPKATSPTRASSATKRPREEEAPVNTPIYFNSDDFDTTINLDSSLPLGNAPTNEPREHKKLRLSSPRHSRRSSFDRSHSATDQGPRPPLRQAGGLRRVHSVADPIEFSSSPGVLSRPTTTASAAPTAVDRLDSDDPFAALPPSAQPVPKTQNPLPNATVTGVGRINYNLSSDDPFASSPPAAPKAITKPCTIVLDDDDDDPFASSPRRAPVEAMKPPDSKKSSAAESKGKEKAVSPRRKANWDPISSSAPEFNTRSDPFGSSPLPARRTMAKAASAVIDLSDSEPEPVVRNLDADSDGEFPDLDNFDVTKLRARLNTKKPATKLTSKATSKTTSKSNAGRAATTKTAEDRTREKEEKAAEREREKERKKHEKEVAKEQKAKEKERAAALAEVNKIRTDKKVSTPEMIADLPASLPAAVTLQIQTLLKDLDVQHAIWNSPVDNVVKWRRKVASHFNDELGHWEPIPMRIQPDKYALVIVTASEFVTYALGPEGNNLETHVSKMKRHFPEEQLIYLIEGLNPWMRKNRNVRNRQFASAVRNQGEDAAAGAAEASTSAQPQAQPRRGRKNQQQQQQPQQYIDEDSVEDALLQLQVMYDVLIHHTNAAVETAHWVAIFTQHISTVPYRKQREATNAAGAGFCMETGQVRTGEDVKDTYVRMLQEVARVTQPVAYGIVSEFGTVTELVKAFEERGPLCLENCRKSTNKDGGFSDRAVGKAVSKRIYKIFMETDEWSTDV